MLFRSVEELIELGTQFFDTLADARPEFEEVADRVRELQAEPGNERELGTYMADQRKQTILLSTTTLRVIAGAMHKAMARDEEDSPKVYAEALGAVDFTPKSKLFVSAGFVGQNGTPNARNQEVIAATNSLEKVLRP